MASKLRSRRAARWTVRLIAALAIPALGFIAWDQANHNLGRFSRDGCTGRVRCRPRPWRTTPKQSDQNRLESAQIESRRVVVP